MKISIIVPVYNAERYLDKLVQSVLSQTYEDYELILVDDSSKDNSYSLMKKYQEMDSRIKAYTKENTGPGLTRKFGFEKSSGDLFFFVDSDDWITTSDVLREINDLFEKNEKIDVLFFDREDIIGDQNLYALDRENWRKLYKKIKEHGDLSKELAVQFLPVTLKTNYLDDELKQIISPVYEMLKNNTIDFEQWNKIQVLLPEVEAYQSWDRCLRVRIALKNKGCSEIV